MVSVGYHSLSSVLTCTEHAGTTDMAAASRVC